MPMMRKGWPRWVSAAVVVVAMVGLTVLVTSGGDEKLHQVAVRTGSGTPDVGGSAVTVGASEVAALAHRTAKDGTRVTAVEIRWGQAAAYGDDSGEWVPPPQCQPVGDLEIGLTGDVYTAMAYASAYDRGRDISRLRGFGMAGHATLGPFVYAAVQTSPDARSARLLVDGDVVDVADPEDGWAFLAAQLPAQEAEDGLALPEDATVEVVTADGTHQLAPDEMQFVPGPECEPPPPALPDDTQPADEAVADAVADAFRAVFAQRDAEVPKDFRALVADGDQLDDELLAEIDELGKNYSDTSGVVVDVHDVRLVDEHTAVVVFRIRNLLGWTIGDASLVDGRWLVSGQTFCNLIAISSLHCPPTMWDESGGASLHT